MFFQMSRTSRIAARNIYTRSRCLSEDLSRTVLSKILKCYGIDTPKFSPLPPLGGFLFLSCGWCCFLFSLLLRGAAFFRLLWEVLPLHFGNSKIMTKLHCVENQPANQSKVEVGCCFTSFFCLVLLFAPSFGWCCFPSFFLGGAAFPPPPFGWRYFPRLLVFGWCCFPSLFVQKILVLVLFR